MYQYERRLALLACFDYLDSCLASSRESMCLSSIGQMMPYHVFCIHLKREHLSALQLPSINWAFNMHHILPSQMPIGIHRLPISLATSAADPLVLANAS